MCLGKAKQMLSHVAGLNRTSAKRQTGRVYGQCCSEANGLGWYAAIALHPAPVNFTNDARVKHTCHPLENENAVHA